VALALYNFYHGIQLSLAECAKKYFGSRKAIPQQSSVCFLGEGIDVRLHFLKDGESWYELGAQKAVTVV
jgi:hypothetical protein